MGARTATAGGRRRLFIRSTPSELALARVELRGLAKAYDDVPAVIDLNLEVNDKEFVVLLGPSGCGKTTTLRCIAGLEEPSAGEIYIGDRLVDRQPSQWSGGQRQRVALGRAIVREPQVFLMDEPLSNLDAKLRVHMRAELKKLQKDLGVTPIYVTHDQVEAMTMAHRVALLNKGVLQQYDGPRDLYSHPANEFTAAFIGSPPINLIDCDLDGRGQLDAADFRIDVPTQFADALPASSGGPLVLGIRPQDVRVSPTEPAE